MTYNHVEILPHPLEIAASRSLNTSLAQPSDSPRGKNSPKLLDQVRADIRKRHYSLRTEESYVHWIRRFIAFHGKRHPRGMGAAEIEAFLSDLAVRQNVAASTQNLALSAILFLYRDVLEVKLSWLDGITRAKKPQRRPVVFSRKEAVNRSDLLGLLTFGLVSTPRHPIFRFAVQMGDCDNGDFIVGYTINDAVRKFPDKAPTRSSTRTRICIWKLFDTL
jgi:hypothetical protein